MALSSAARPQRLPPVFAFAHLLLLLLGLICSRQMSAAHWASALSQKRKQVSAFLVRWLMPGKTEFRLSHLFHVLPDKVVRGWSGKTRDDSSRWRALAGYRCFHKSHGTDM